METGERFTDDILLCIPGGVRHDPQRYMGKTVNVPHFNPDTVEYAPRERDDRIKILLPFLKNITEESDLENLIFKMSWWP